MKVAVIGAGFAGLAAAVDLQERRHQVTLLERRGVLGGRATSYRDAVSGEDVDNGTHLMVGAYAATFDLLRRAGAEDLLIFQDDLHIDYVDDRGWSALDCPPLAAPLHLLAGLLSLRLPWAVRWQALRLWMAVRFGKPPLGMTLAEYLRRNGQGPDARRLLWDPLATAILNETPERAAAVLFYNVYREAFLTRRDASRLVFLRRGYAELHERVARYFQHRGGVLRRRALAETIPIEGGRVCGVRYLQRAETRDEIRQGKDAVAGFVDADAVVAAVPWNAVPPLVPEALRLGGSPIVSVEMWLDRVVVDRPMAGLRDSEMEWVFDKGSIYGRTGPPQHLAFIVSAARRSAERSNQELVASAEASLREADATFASDPEAEAVRPGPVTPVRGLYLAGDWTATGLPATIEGAVRSGLAAARAAEAG